MSEAVKFEMAITMLKYAVRRHMAAHTDGTFPGIPDETFEIAGKLEPAEISAILTPLGNEGPEEVNAVLQTLMGKRVKVTMEIME